LLTGPLEPTNDPCHITRIAESSSPKAIAASA
jgi:hypothetical protein